MGKLNYTNRKVEGLKLGQVIHKDLIKRIPPEAGSKAALRDPYIELHASGKRLGDEGLLAVVEGLRKALSCRDGPVTSRLEELGLSGNELTASSMRHLGGVIKLAADDLKDVDLSCNQITVATDEQATAWESFLRSFRKSSVLRRLDLSGNALGSRAFEILARVYTREAPLDMSEVTPAEDEGGLQNGMEASLSPTSPHAPVANPERYAVTRGIRSIPYIVLSDVAMTDTCALHLSVVLARHHLLRDLLARVPSAKTGLAAQHLDVYDAHSGCQGIVYLPNDTLGGAGMRVLELAEVRREELLEGDYPETAKSPSKRAHSLRASSDSSTTSAVFRGPRQRQSAEQPTSTGELERVRSKIQGNTLKERGARHVELWATALRLLVSARAILLAPKPPPVLVVMPQRDISSRPRQSVAKAQPSVAARAAPHRPRARGNLPHGVWHGILALAVDPSGILRGDQQAAVLAWAGDRATLAREAEVVGKPAGVQIWRVLEGVGCLSYDERGV
ncbi:MAG: hypothetical protein M1832_001129 [Thelocarpon impressellum]|nr:MAG: hypothetical protein M1832_001129 [Thelocarpon impressellum]